MALKFTVLPFLISLLVSTEQRDLKTSHVLDQDILNFLIAGDFGGWPPPFYTTPTQLQVAEKMGESAAQNKATFVIANGDNFYFLGVKDERDERFKLTFEDVYVAPSLQVPWYPTMGNHDWHGSGQAQLDYSHISNRWTYPDFWYTLDYTLAPSNTKVRIVIMDTTIPCGTSSNGEAINGTMAEEQWQWVEEQLKQGQDADHLIVVGHYPVIAAGNTGPTNPLLYEKLRPLLEQYGVSAYISGHEHNLQHLKDSAPNTTTEYFVVGCSNFVSPRLPHKDAKELSLQFGWSEMKDLGGCFARVEISPASMKMILVQGRDGQEIYSYEIPSRNN